MIQFLEDEEPKTVFDVALDDETVAWLIGVCEGCNAPPAVVIAAMLRDLRQDDEAAHDISKVPPRTGMSLN